MLDIVKVAHQHWFRGLLILVVLTNVALFVIVGFRPDSLEHVYFLNVGQGDATLIKTNQGRYILIDGGPNNKVVSLLDNIIPMWQRRLDLVILTHPHADHATGLLSVLDQYQVSEFWYTGTTYDSETFPALMAKVTNQQIPVQLANQGDVYNSSATQLKVLFPADERPTAKDPNETSIVNLLTYKNFSILFTGDASSNNEKTYSPHVPDVDIVKIPHHGSASASSQVLIEKADSEIGVISVGAKNSFGHPNSEVVGRYETSGAKLYRTDQHGTVEIITDGERYKVL
jgi:beta-lactamase superfamily II metal-dependent hydrolase